MLGHKIKVGMKLRRIIPQEWQFENNSDFAQPGDVVTVGKLGQITDNTNGYSGFYYKFGSIPVYDCTYSIDHDLNLITAWEIVE